MPHSEQTTAVLTANEPPNGTKLIVHERSGNDETWRVIVRDDDSAADWDQFPENRWFDGKTGGEPYSLREWLDNADAVYALGEKLAEFR